MYLCTSEPSPSRPSYHGAGGNIYLEVWQRYAKLFADKIFTKKMDSLNHQNLPEFLS